MLKYLQIVIRSVERVILIRPLTRKVTGDRGAGEAPPAGVRLSDGLGGNSEG
jgi:hypothetical protein